MASLLILSGAILIALSTLAFADCGRVSIRILGTDQERSAACRALDEVLGYLAAGGFDVHGKLTVRFRPAVYVRSGSLLRTEEELAPVSGLYAAAFHEIEILRSTSESFERRPWGLSWDAAMAFSISEHEIVHWVIAELMGDRYEMLPHAWHEALAYAVQIELMPPHLRNQVLDRYPLEAGFTNTLQINEMVYGLDPDRFAVAAYRTYKKGGGVEFLKKAIRLELEMIDLDDFLPD